MGLEHESVEMHAPLLFDADIVEEKVHQERLAAPDIAVKVNPLRTWFGRCRGASEPAAPAWWLMLQPAAERVQNGSRARLGGIWLKLSGLNEAAILIQQKGRDGRSSRRQFFPFRSFRLIRTSAIWIAFNAAPFRRLSETTHSDRPFSTVGSLRIRLTYVASSPAASTGVM